MMIKPDTKLEHMGRELSGADLEFRDRAGNLVEDVLWYDPEHRRYGVVKRNKRGRVLDEAGEPTEDVIEGELTWRPAERIRGLPEATYPYSEQMSERAAAEADERSAAAPDDETDNEREQQ